MRSSACLIFAAVSCFAQSAGESAHFEVASVKPVVDNRPGPYTGGPGGSDPGRVSYGRTSVRNLIWDAYEVPSGRISGPSSLDSYYAVSAIYTAGATMTQYREMLANLLAERFGLIFHRVPTEVHGYELVVADGGPKFSAAPTETPEQTSARRFLSQNLIEDGVLHMTFNHAPLGLLADRISAAFNPRPGGASPTMPVINKTGLTGQFDLKLEIPLEPSMGPSGPIQIGGQPYMVYGDHTVTPKSASTALEKQLGLKLNPVKLTVDFIVVDHLNQTPTEN